MFSQSTSSLTNSQSGTGVITDDARGMYPGDVIYNDTDVEQIKSIPDTAFHRNVDLLVVHADLEGYVRSHIILPSTIYGIATHALVNAGVSNAHSIQIPILVRASDRASSITSISSFSVHPAVPAGPLRRRTGPDGPVATSAKVS